MPTAGIIKRRNGKLLIKSGKIARCDNCCGVCPLCENTAPETFSVVLSGVTVQCGQAPGVGYILPQSAINGAFDVPWYSYYEDGWGEFTFKYCQWVRGIEYLEDQWKLDWHFGAGCDSFWKTTNVDHVRIVISRIYCDDPDYPPVGAGRPPGVTDWWTIVITAQSGTLPREVFFGAVAAEGVECTNVGPFADDVGDFPIQRSFVNGVVTIGPK